jgi:hypothetical protein
VRLGPDEGDEALKESHVKEFDIPGRPMKPQEKTNPIRTILVYQLLSERRFFSQSVGTDEPPVEELLPSGEKPVVQAYIDRDRLVDSVDGFHSGQVHRPPPKQRCGAAKRDVRMRLPGLAPILPVELL